MNAALDSEHIAAALHGELATEGAIAESSGDAIAALRQSAKTVDVTYYGAVPRARHDGADERHG